MADQSVSCPSCGKKIPLMRGSHGSEASVKEKQECQLRGEVEKARNEANIHAAESGLMSRYRGALLGLATGDALGTTLEFKPPGTFTPIDDMIGGGPFHLQPGQWTDDTSMALCLAESLIECGEFDPIDQLSRYVRWKRTGHHSSTGRCFDVGGTVRAALARFERHSKPWSGSADEHTAGNGSIMRLAPRSTRMPLRDVPSPIPAEGR